MNFAEALRKAHENHAPAIQEYEAPRHAPTYSDPMPEPQPNLSFDPVPDQHIPEDPHPAVNGSVVRLEIFLSAEQLSGLFRAIMAGQHSIMTLREAAAYLRVNASSLQKLADDGEVPGVVIDGKWRFPKGNLDDWLTLQSGSHEENEDVA